MLEVIENRLGRKYFKTEIDVVLNEHQSLDNPPYKSIPFVFDANCVVHYRPSLLKGENEEEMTKTCVDFHGGEQTVINCEFEIFHKAFMKI